MMEIPKRCNFNGEHGDEGVPHFLTDPFRMLDAREAPRRSGARSTERSKSKSSGFQMWSDGVAGWWFGT